MKLDKLIVIGNPPYQTQSEAQKERVGGEQQAKPLYHLFVEAIIDGLNPDYFSFIIPSRWMVGGMGLSSHRERMMNDRRMKKIVHFPGEKEIFPTVSIKGGVNYFLWDKSYNGECEFQNGNTNLTRPLNQFQVVVQDNNSLSILNKVLDTSSKFMSSQVLPSIPFGLKTNYSDWTPSGLKCIARGGKEFFCDVTKITDKRNILNLWKVATSRATSEGNLTESKEGKRKIISNIFLVEPNVVVTETYIVLKTFTNKDDALNFKTYVSTKFFRFLLSLNCAVNNTSDNYCFVPDVEDYSKPWTDYELYKKYNLTEEEIVYIESKIKSL